MMSGGGLRHMPRFHNGGKDFDSTEEIEIEAALEHGCLHIFVVISFSNDAKIKLKASPLLLNSPAHQFQRE